MTLQWLRLPLCFLHQNSDNYLLKHLIKPKCNYFCKIDQTIINQYLYSNNFIRECIWMKVPREITTFPHKLLIWGARGLNFLNSTPVLVESKTLSIFVQTDKAIYKAGQKGMLIMASINAVLIYFVVGMLKSFVFFQTNYNFLKTGYHLWRHCIVGLSVPNNVKEVIKIGPSPYCNYQVNKPMGTKLLKQ